MRRKIHLLLIAIAIRVVFSISTYNYCAMPTCLPRTHILCNRTISDVATARCGQVIRHNITLEERNTIISLHNYFRETVYTGIEYRGNPGPQPPAANVTFLEWDRELALAAQTAAQQCPDGPDQCRNVARFLVNQHVAKKRTIGSIDELSIEEILWLWFQQVQRFDHNLAQNYSSHSASTWLTRHYTQMVWENTTQVGCGQILYFDGVYNRLTFVCNYGPRGNINGQPVYTIRNPLY